MPRRDPCVGDPAKLFALRLSNRTRSLSPVVLTEFPFAVLQMIRAVTGELVWTNPR